MAKAPPLFREDRAGLFTSFLSYSLALSFLPDDAAPWMWRV